jgi:hypothetical protein
VVDDPIGGIYDILTATTKKREECTKWGLWMLRKGEIEKGLKVSSSVFLPSPVINRILHTVTHTTRYTQPNHNTTIIQTSKTQTSSTEGKRTRTFGKDRRSERSCRKEVFGVFSFEERVYCYV